MTGVTETEAGEKEELLDRYSELGDQRTIGGIRYDPRQPL